MARIVLAIRKLITDNHRMHAHLRLIFSILVSSVLHAYVFFAKGEGIANSASNAFGALQVKLTPTSLIEDELGETQTQSAQGKSPSAPIESPNDLSFPPHSLHKEDLIRVAIDDYLPPEWLTERPRPIEQLDPTPQHIRLPGVVGEARLLLLISSEGDVDQAIIVSSSLPSPIVEYALQVFKNAKFIPGRIKETAVRSRYLVYLSMQDEENAAVEPPRSSKQIRERQLLLPK